MPILRSGLKCYEMEVANDAVFLSIGGSRHLFPAEFSSFSCPGTLSVPAQSSFFDKNNIFLIVLVTILQLFLGAWAAFAPGNNTGTISAVSTILYAAFYFLAIKKHFGKTFFTLLMISNLASLAVISSKTIENLFFPDLAVQSYRWSFSLMLAVVEIILAIPLFFYMKKVYTPAVEKEPSGFEWRYLWVIPATFYVMWYYAFYGNASKSSLEIALHP